MDELIKQIVENGIEVTIKKCYRDNCEGRIVYDLDTQAKSHLFIEPLGDDEWVAYMRYDEVQKLQNPTVEDIVELVKHCMHYREFVNYYWKLLF